MRIAKLYIFLAIIAFFSGALFFAVYNSWIIFQFPSHTSEVYHQISSMKAEKKDFWLMYWQNKKWNKEKISLLLSGDKAKNIQYLVNSWLNLLDEEKVMDKKVSLQTVLLSSCKSQAYLSFDRNPFEKKLTTYDKLMWIESLLKTLRENDIRLQSVYFLVHHQILQDYHLDFSNPWPMYGFLQQ
ncbi:hypothetical protein ACFLYA_01765 [Candidatus Dependentiae bacterium]